MRPTKMNAGKMAEYILTPEHSGESFHRDVNCQLLPPARKTMAVVKASVGMSVAMFTATLLTFLQ